MLQLISITLIALAGFSFAAPIGNRHEVLPIVDAIPSANIIPISWKRDSHQTSSDFGVYSKLINSAINEILSKRSKMIKRQTGLPTGLPSNGLPSDGLPPNEIPSNGLPSNGLSSDGNPSNGELGAPPPLNAPLGDPLAPPIEEPLEDSMTAPLGTPLTTPLDDPFTATSENPLPVPLADPLSSPLGNPLSSPLGNPLAPPLGNPLAAPLGDPLTAPLTPPLDIFSTPFDLETAFRGFFDKFVDFIIQVTPLNDIVHGNYDLLYELFKDIVKDAISNIGQPPAEGGSPIDIFSILSSLDIFGGGGGSPFDFLGNPGLLFPPIFDNPFEGSLDKSNKHYKHESKKGGKKWDDSDNDDEDSEDDDDECETDDDEE